MNCKLAPPNTIYRNATEGRWVLLVNHDGLTNRFISKKLAGLLTKVENLLEYEDEQDEWEMKQARRNDTCIPKRAAAPAG